MGKEFIITEKQLKKIVENLKTSLNEETKEGSYMAKQQLFVIATLANKMWESMEEGEQLEDWMESKIAQCEQSIISVVKSYMYGEFVEDGNPKNGFNPDEIIIGK